MADGAGFAIVEGFASHPAGKTRCQTCGVEVVPRSEYEKLRRCVLRQWAETHRKVCGCDYPDDSHCEWPVPIPHTNAELCEATEERDG